RRSEEGELGTSISADLAARAADRLGVQSQTGLWSLHDLIGRQSPLLHACLLPKPAGKLHGIDAGRLPPGAFVACPMRGPVMHAAKRDREFIAYFAARRAWLDVAQMMGIGWLAAAHEAWLLHANPRLGTGSTMTLRYPVKLEADDNRTVLATCPSLPEVTTFGEDDADALVHAVDAIEEALAAR